MYKIEKVLRFSTRGRKELTRTPPSASACSKTDRSRVASAVKTQSRAQSICARLSCIAYATVVHGHGVLKARERCFTITSASERDRGTVFRGTPQSESEPDAHVRAALGATDSTQREMRPSRTYVRCASVRNNLSRFACAYLSFISRK